MVSELHSVHTTILDLMADFPNSPNTENSIPNSTSPLQPHIVPHITKSVIAPLHIPNIHFHIAPKVQLDEQNYMA
jgi:hypothetical protein